MRRILLALLASSSLAQADHGLDYLVLQDGTAPALWKLTSFTAADFSRTDGFDELNVESGLLLGLGRDFGLGVGFGFIDEDAADWRYSTVTPYLNLPLFRSDDLPWLKVSLYAGYQFAEEPPLQYQTLVTYETPASRSTKTQSAKSSPVTKPQTTTNKSSAKVTKTSTISHQPRHGGGTVGGGGPDAPGGGTGHNHPVAAPTAAPQASNQKTSPAKPIRMERRVPIDPNAGAAGIHRHGESGMVTRLITSVRLSEKDQMVMNFINFTPEEGNVGWGYAIGYRHSFHHDLAVSLEAIGDLDSSAYHECVLGLHYSPVHNVIVRLGAGTGLGTESTDVSIHTGLVIRF